MSLGILFCLSAALSFSDAAAPGSSAQKRDLQYDISVTLKLVQVYVTDKSGQPVRDLVKEDFAVFDGGKPVAITEFERYDFLRPASPPGRPSAAEPKASSPPALSRKYLLFFDFAYNDQRGTVAGLKVAGRFLDSVVRPEDEVAVISYSALKGLRVHEFLTRDHAKVRRALADLSAKDIAGRAEEIEQMYAMAVQEGLGNLSAAAQFNLVSRRQESKNQAGDYFRALTSLAKAMRLVEGQKQFLFFSSGWPYSLIHGSEPAVGQYGAAGRSAMLKEGTRFDMGDPILRPLSEDMFKELSAGSCSIFSFDTREAASLPSLFAFEDKRETVGAPSIGGVVQPRTDLLRDDKTTGQNSLSRLSKETGGRYFSNIAFFEDHLEAVQNATGTYYVLGYPLSAPMDGDFHKLKVEVKRKGCRVRTQSGYFDPKPYEDYTAFEKQLHLFDLALDEGAFSRLPAKVPMTALISGAEGVMRLAVLAEVPAEATSKLSGKRVEFVAIFFDDNGEIPEIVREEADPAPFRGREIVFAAGATLRPGDYSCRLVVRDLDTGLSAVASTRATIGKLQATGLQLGTPLLLGEKRGRAFLIARARKAAEAFPWADIYPFDSSLYSPVLNEWPKNQTGLRAVIPFAVPGGTPDLALTANLVNSASGERLPVTIADSERIRKGLLEILTIDIPTLDIAPGTYYLHFYAQDRASGSLGHTFTTLEIK